MELIPVLSATGAGDGLQPLTQYNPSDGSIQLRDSDSGQLYTLGLAPTDVHIDSTLATYCAGYNQDKTSLAEKVCPTVPVDKASNYFWTWDIKDAFEYVDRMEVAGGSLGGVPEIAPRLSSTLYTTKCFAVAGVVPLEVQSNADAPLNPQLAAASRAMNAQNLRRELQVKTLLDTSGNWTGGYSTAVIAKWNGGAGSDPIEDLKLMIRASAQEPNYIVMSRVAYDYFIQHPAVNKYIVKGSMGDTAMANKPENANKVSAILDLPEILVGKMKYRSAATTYSTYIWGNNVFGIYQEPSIPVDGQRVMTCKNFRWTGPQVSPDGSSVSGFYVRRYFDPRRGPYGAWIVVVVVNEAPTMTSVYVGGRITGAYA